MHDEVVARIHVCRLQVALEMLVGVEPERYVELFAFVDGLLACGKRYAECIVGIGALDVDGDFARDGVALSVKFDHDFAGIQAPGLLGSP